jgi:two-component system nitrate/nitrite response regulator NarL
MTFLITLEMIRILIVHPTRLVCSLYASVINERPNMEVVAQATTVKEALFQAKNSGCNIILVSASLEDNGALTLTKKVAQDYPGIKVLVVGLPESKYVILQYVMAGASGYVLQDVTVDNLLQNIVAAEEDKALVSPTMAAALIGHVAELAHISAQSYLHPEIYSELTTREMEVLELIDDGCTNQEIAKKLVIEVGTVKNHVHNILKKLNVASRKDAAAHLPYIEPDENE